MRPTTVFLAGGVLAVLFGLSFLLVPAMVLPLYGITPDAFEVILDRIPEAKQKPTRAKPVLELSAFQPVSRDFAFIVDRSIRAGDIVRAAQAVDKKLITDVGVFDVYEGKGIESGKKSIAIAVTMQPREKTMTDQEIDAVGAKIVSEVAKKTGGTLRA